jgi:hypothetical protein
MRNANQIVAPKPKRKKLLLTPRHKWEYNIKMDREEIEREV